MPDKSFPAARNLVAEGGVVVSRTDDEAKVRDSVYWSNCKPAKGSPQRAALDGDRGCFDACAARDHDLTPLHSRAALLGSEKELRDVVNAVPAFVWTTLPDGAVDFVNEHWLESRVYRRRMHWIGIGKPRFIPMTDPSSSPIGRSSEDEQSVEGEMRVAAVGRRISLVVPPLFIAAR